MHSHSSTRSRSIYWLCVCNWQPISAASLHAAGSRQLSVSLLVVVSAYFLSQPSDHRRMMDHNEKSHSLQFEFGSITPLPPIPAPHTNTHTLASHALFCFSTKPLIPPAPAPSASLPLLSLAPAAVNSRIPVCVSVHPSLFPCSHYSIPFFHVCSAVKPSWIRPASLVTCSLCWCGNKQC